MATYHVQALLLFFSWCMISEFSSARDNITTTQFLKDSETLVSSKATFRVGFFSPSNSTNRYVGIWYNMDPREVVWVANREQPLTDSSGVLQINWDGNLQLFDGKNNCIWSSNITVKNEVNTSVAKLLDSGNLVLSTISGNIIWQSFEHPGNSMLPHMDITSDGNANEMRGLRSWKNVSDPSNGRFTAGIYHRKLSEIFIWDGDKPHWRSGPWDGHIFMGVRSMYYFGPLKRFQFENDNEGPLSLSFSSTNETAMQHYVLTSDGVVLHKEWNVDVSDWRILWQTLESKTQCDIYGTCGEFGICNSKDLPICSCLKGFAPSNNQEWSAGNWSNGCVRKNPLQGGSITGKKDGFLRLGNMKLPDNGEWLYSHDEDDCSRQCLEHRSCLAYAYYLGFGCIIWSGSLIDIQDFSPVGVDLYIRLASSELVGGFRKRKVLVAVTVITTGTAALVVLLYYLRTLMDPRYGKTTKEDEQWLKSYMVGAGVSEVLFQDPPLFRFKNLVVATNNFSEGNKLGQGGFGTVYKGKFEDGRDIAVKRLSAGSAQGVQEFMNEVVLISKLQHRNLVRLLGCCVEGEEKLLVYEYMPNKSLDEFLFDSDNREHLDWNNRFSIIKGISRGLLYLHRDSRLRIIHRDLKASNILLDGNLNPKISDFGMAKILGGNQDQANTKRIVGTYGYMSPEYAMAGQFSEKSDVFSFGVLLLEIVSGRRNNSFKDDESISLLGHAWKLWNENKILSLVDPTITESVFIGELLRCIHLGLLCVQEIPKDRPNISMVISIIENEIADLPCPKQPGFTLKKTVSRHECSINRVTLSLSIGR